MRKILALALGFSLVQPVLACIAIPISDNRPNRIPQSMRLAEQRAFVYRQGDKQHLVLSIQYDGAPREFAWIIPVDSRPEVDVQSGAPINELRRITRIVEPVKATESAVRSAPGGAPPTVEVLERKEAGPYDLAVLRASETGGLYDWLQSNKFYISKDARGALDYYVTRKYVFVAARIRPGAQGNETIADRLKQGTIAPLHMVYKAKKLSYPLKVTSGNPGISHMELYVLNPKVQSFGPISPVTFQIKPHGKTGFAVSGQENLANPTGDFPTIRKLVPRGGTLVKLEADLDDSQRRQDLVFE